MRQTITILAGLLALSGACMCAAQQQAAAERKRALPIIPGAAGFGMDTPAGSGRHLDPPHTTVYKVTNLNTSGPGSLTAALEAEGPRVVVFEVSGNIDFRPYRALAINNPYLTVAGQTAPSPGITLVGCELHLNAHDVSRVDGETLAAGERPRTIESLPAAGRRAEPGDQAGR
jgi:hypothetical protein